MAKRNRHTTLARALARAGDPLVLPDGSVIDEDQPAKVFNPDDRSTLRSNVEPKDYRPTTRRAIKDFPANSTMFSAIAVVFAHTIYGLSNIEICEVLNLSTDQLDQIRNHRGYTELFNSIMNEFINANSEMLQSRIAAYSHSAISQVGHLISHAKKEEVRLSASKDVLDRAGARPQDLANQHASQMDGLRINIIKSEQDVQVEINIGGNSNDQESYDT